MYHVHSRAEETALRKVIDLGKRLSETPNDEALRVRYKTAQAMLRDHSRAGNLIYRATHMPAPLHVSIDTRGLAAFLQGADL